VIRQQDIAIQTLLIHFHNTSNNHTKL